ncbi:hypothetical protein T440DRAFT_442625 [Plenodomus tracheiphilus IPT5]|uniref:Initiator tRNA phosphoribosyl transferase n=1 Tax=Plenodomus tracheiphilus IPT5 TaxID=1408161 RepID=A0A6A7BFF6_9PLEO|nr:hypothetical protein T440DRAFT_442625 [Plenodomus tracheiphilus IPT5]
MTQPIRESDILFPHQSNTPSLSTTLSTLRRSTLSLQNRLSSITFDSLFVTSVASAYDLPLVANERCGSWYIPPAQKEGSVYFKSTDGHMGQWKFSLRRLNLQLLDVVAERGGAVVVDSTRRGKSMPDALSKTVPVWCAVVNRAVFGESGGDGERARLHVPPSAVGESEKVQMEGMIEGFVKQFVEICKPHIPGLRAKLTKPLRPIWVTQASSLPSTPPSFPDFHPIVLCTASRRVQGAEISENGYIQGAADDHEAWSHGLTPQLFWRNKEFLMNTTQDDAPRVIEKLIAESDGGIATTTLINPTKNLYISTSENVDLTNFDAVFACTPTPHLFGDSKAKGPKHYLHLKCQTGKLGSRDLRTQLPRLPYLLTSLPSLSSSKILVCCPTGKDLAVGTALAILCLAADDQGNMNGQFRTEAITKDFIKQRLSWITTSNPALNPSRATLQSVNTMLFDTRIQQQPSPSMTDTSTTPKNPSHANTHDKPPPKISIQEQIFTSLYSSSQPWQFSRTLSSVLPTHPSGRVTGTATFTPCKTDTGVPTLLYAEEGEFVLENGMRFGVKRRYVYLLRAGEAEEEEKYIAVHFFDDEKTSKTEITHGVGGNGEAIGDLFVEMDTLHFCSELHDQNNDATTTITNNTNKKEFYKANNKQQHLCAEDLYTASWKFSAGMVGRVEQEQAGKEDGGDGGDVWWEVRYDVKGPKKDYSSCTVYTLA